MDIEVDNDSHVFYADGIATSNSHGVAYAYNSYMSAWYKANYTYDFFMTYLDYSGFKPKPHREVYELVSESKVFNIEYKMPTLDHYTARFSRKDNVIYFGVQNIQNLTGVNGTKSLQVIEQVAKDLNKEVSQLSWLDILLLIGSKIDATSFKTLASIGFFSTKSTGVTRNTALYEYSIFRNLTKKEEAWVLEQYPDKQWSSLLECFKDVAPVKKEGGGTSNVNRKQIIEGEIYMLENPPYDLSDDPTWVVDQETKLAGCPISISRIEASSTRGSNTTCKDIMNGKTGDNICLAGSITRVATHKVKRGKTKGQKMSFLTIEDETCALDSVILFPDRRSEYEMLLYEGNNLMFCGSVDKDNSFIIDKIHEI